MWMQKSKEKKRNFVQNCFITLNFSLLYFHISRKCALFLFLFAIPFYLDADIDCNFLPSRQLLCKEQLCTKNKSPRKVVRSVKQCQEEMFFIVHSEEKNAAWCKPQQPLFSNGGENNVYTGTLSQKQLLFPIPVTRTSCFELHMMLLNAVL
jgi:hypothetical protein